MITEGIGVHAPAVVKQRLDPSSLRVVFQAARKISAFRQYATSKSEWKRGFVSPLVIQGLGTIPADHAPRFIGLCAEAAVVLYLNRVAGMNLSLDDRLRCSGDGGSDLIVHKLTMQIKSRQSDTRHAKSKISLVRMTNEAGRNTFPTATALVFCETVAIAKLVNLLGWIYSIHAKTLPEVPGRRGGHTNIEVPDSQLQPMHSLVDLITARKELLA